MTSQDSLRLDTDQLEASRAEVGPVLVEGAPGSGKTTVLITRAVLLLRNNVPPKSIFFLIPNNRQALEIGRTFTREVQRLTKRISPETADAVQKATPQAFAASYLRRFNTGTQGIPNKFTLWSRRKTAEVIGRFATAGNHTSRRVSQRHSGHHTLATLPMVQAPGDRRPRHSLSLAGGHASL